MNNKFNYHERNEKGLTYTVKPGDSLYKIANMFQTTVDSLMYVNGLQNTILNNGQILIISEPQVDIKPKVYENYDQFIEQNSGKGTLKVHVYIAGGIYPLQGVRVEISKKIGGEKKIFFAQETEESGIVDNVILPAPSNYNYYQPITTEYQIETIHDSYRQLHSHSTHIYDGIKSIQSIEMFPIEKEKRA